MEELLLKLQDLASQWSNKQVEYQKIALDQSESRHAASFNGRATATRDCRKQLGELLEEVELKKNQTEPCVIHSPDFETLKIIDKMEKKLEYLKAELEKMYAVELLEYHDKNHLAGDNKSRCEKRQEQLQYAMKLAAEITETVEIKEPETIWVNKHKGKLGGGSFYATEGEAKANSFSAAKQVQFKEVL